MANITPARTNTSSTSAHLSPSVFKFLLKPLLPTLQCSFDQTSYSWNLAKNPYELNNWNRITGSHLQLSIVLHLFECASLTDPLLILISLLVKGEFIPNCERGGTLIYLNSSKHSSDAIWQQIIWWALLQHGEYCYSRPVCCCWVGNGRRRERLCLLSPIRLYLRCTKLPTDIQTNTISGATCFAITVTGMWLFAHDFDF